MNILITGATGFIGSNLIRSKYLKKHKIYCLYRNNKKKLFKKDNITWFKSSLNKNNKKIFKKIDLIIHLASHSTNPPYDSLDKCLLWNLHAPLKFFNHAYYNGVKKFIVIGTGFEYGDSCKKYNKTPTSAPLQPTTTYAVSKAASSLIFQQWASDKKVLFKYIRLFYIFGNNENNKRFWPSLKKSALNGDNFYMTKGEQVRDFANVDDVVNHIIKETNFKGAIKGLPIVTNFGSGDILSMKKFAEIWWKKFNAEGKIYFDRIKYRKNELMRYVPKI